MSESFSERPDPPPRRKWSSASTYSAHIQEAMRYDKLCPPDYAFVMGLLHAVVQGYTEEQWKDEQHRSLQSLRLQPPDKRNAHADAVNRYEQTRWYLQDLRLWPW